MSSDNAMPALIQAEHICDGTAAVERGPCDPERQVIEFTTRVLLRIQRSHADCVALADLMAACYYAGQRQERRRADCGLPRVEFPAGTPSPDTVANPAHVYDRERIDLFTGAITEEGE